MVNVIPYNPGTAPVARAPEPEEVERFASMLYARGLGVRRRETRGRGIMAGCGQLGSGAGGNGRSVPHGPERSRIAEDA
jgi:adenine C2-methylase RlmN of 23S rRNA A2503 and tRNA A37